MKNLKKILKNIQLWFQNFDSASWMQILSLLVFVIAIIVAAYFFMQRGGPSSESLFLQDTGDENYYANSQDQLQHCEFRKSVDGECVENEQQQQQPLVAIMVENHFEANPLSGIADAAVVYEAPVEGSIPRFLAIYPVDSDVKKVGPVRSARPYFLDWISEFDAAMYMHVGGSPEALQKIINIGIFDMNEFSRGWYFWRDNNRYAPHNVYTSAELWQAAHARYSNSSTPVSHEGWLYLPAETCEVNCVQSVSFSYGGGSYNPQWRFVSSTGQYERYQFNKEHRDADGAPYVADTVVIQQVDGRVLDGVGRLGLGTIGEGEGWVLRDGYATRGTWRKESLTDKTRWYDETNKEIPFKSGKIWVQVVSQFNSFEMK